MLARGEKKIIPQIRKLDKAKQNKQKKMENLEQRNGE